MENIEVKTVQIKKISLTTVDDMEDQVAVEEPLEIQIQFVENGNTTTKSISVTMRTPGNDSELAIGFLFTEGILFNPAQVKDVFADEIDKNKIMVTLHDGELPILKSAERNFYTTSSCGVCGKASIDAIKTVSAYGITQDSFRVTQEVLCRLPKLLREQQAIFESTGGLHASALFTTDGDFFLLREDVGRHNALDKVIGASFLNLQLPLSDIILLLSGRASFELIQKAVMAGIKIVAAVGAPSSLAVSLAQENEVTLIGFLKADRFNIYSGAKRIVLV